MNAARRKQIEAFVRTLEGVAGGLENVQIEIADVATEERDAFEAMPENLQESDRGQAVELAADNLEEAASQVEEAMTALTSAIDALTLASEG